MRNTKKKFNKNNSPLPTLEGIIHVHFKGFGFVLPHDVKKHPKDIFIPKHLKANAVDGDTVKVAVYPTRRSKKGPEGHVLEIIKRGKQELVGTVVSIHPGGDYILYIPCLGQSRSACVHKKGEIEYKTGDRLLLLVKDWGKENSPVLCEVLEEIGSIDDPAADISAAIKDFQIEETFPKEVLQEAHAFAPEVGEKERGDRTDLTHLECFTIDPNTAKDFDDALSLTKDAQGHYHLGIHIADVSHYVTPHSALNQAALKRCNSTYFPGRCTPMLPEALSNHLCSLRENVIRLTISVLVTLDSKGEVLDYQIVKAFIKSRKRFTYRQAKEVLNGTAKSPYRETLHLMQTLCLLLKQKRFERGSVDLALPELELLIDEKGKPYGYQINEYDITHQLVEEFMLKANEIVAESLVKKNLPALFRIHESPAQENLEDFYSLARSLGFALPDKPKNRDVQRLFELASQTPHVSQLSIAFIRSMKLAIYSTENVGHYGLALENYCHFTSPIRRFSDLAIHRLLFDVPHKTDLEEISRICSEKERRSFKAETSVINLKKLRLLKQYQKENPERIYEATITKSKSFGIAFKVSPLLLDGFIPTSELHDDTYIYHPKIQGLIGKRSGVSLIMGRALKVGLKKVDLILLESKWEILQL